MTTKGLVRLADDLWNQAKVLGHHLGESIERLNAKMRGPRPHQADIAASVKHEVHEAYGAVVQTLPLLKRAASHCLAAYARSKLTGEPGSPEPESKREVDQEAVRRGVAEYARRKYGSVPSSLKLEGKKGMSLELVKRHLTSISECRDPGVVLCWDCKERKKKIAEYVSFLEKIARSGTIPVE